MPALDSESLKEWFLENKREFPWRRDVSAYGVWVSEVMLQQTRAQVVVGYFQRWMQRFPSIAHLAEAPLEEVMKTWEGLGYYSRARNLHEAARYLAEHQGGSLPSTREELEKIKGLGPYTIGAILSFAFHQKAAAVDGNVMRVLSRYFLVEEDIQKSAVKKKLETLGAQVLPDEEPWVIMEALIELGATLCGREPKCNECPLKPGCLAYEAGRASLLPIKEKKIKIHPLMRHVFVIQNKGSLLVKRVEEGRVMAGLYEFPYVEFTGKKKSVKWLHEHLSKSFGTGVCFSHALPAVKHSFTRYLAHLFTTVWRAEGKLEEAEYEWVDKEKAMQLPFSSGHRKILSIISES